MRLTVRHEARWRSLIDEVRELTYAGNWDDYASVQWWDTVDVIGWRRHYGEM